MKRLALGLILLTVALGQSSAPPVAAAQKLFVYYVLPGQPAYSWASVVLDAPLVLSIDSAGHAHLGLPGYMPVTMNTFVTPARVAPPAAPGPCSTESWAADTAFFYACVAEAPPAGGFVWARTPMATSW